MNTLKQSPAHTVVSKRLRSVICPLLTCGLTIYLLAYYLCGWMMKRRIRHILVSWRPVVLALLAVIILYALWKQRSTGTVLLTLNLLWLALTRLALGDNPLESKSICFLAFVLCGLFATSACLRRRERRWFLAIITLLLVAVLILWAAAGIITVLRGRPISRLRRIAVSYEDNIPPLVFVMFGKHHRNVSSAFFAIAAGLLFYWWLGCDRNTWQRRFWAVVTLTYLPFSFCAIALQRCRTIYVAFSFITVFAVVLLARERGYVSAGRRLALAALFAATALMALLYVSLGLCADALLKRSQAEVESKQAAALEQVQREQEQAAVEPSQGTDPEPTPVRRGTVWNTFTFAGRTTIWQEVIPALCAHPEIALLGQSESTAMDVINERITWPYGLEHPVFLHMHNMFLQQLMLAGIPGLLLQVLFVLSLIRSFVRCWRLRTTQPFQTLLMLAAMLVALLCYGMAEPLLVGVSCASMLFCLVAGYFSAEMDDAESIAIR